MARHLVYYRQARCWPLVETRRMDTTPQGDKLRRLKALAPRRPTGFVGRHVGGPERWKRLEGFPPLHGEAVLAAAGVTDVPDGT